MCGLSGGRFTLTSMTFLGIDLHVESAALSPIGVQPTIDRVKNQKLWQGEKKSSNPFILGESSGLNNRKDSFLMGSAKVASAFAHQLFLFRPGVAPMPGVRLPGVHGY
jgi:hypothetical protein